MSVIYCDKCDRQVNTDVEEHECFWSKKEIKESVERIKNKSNDKKVTKINMSLSNKRIYDFNGNLENLTKYCYEEKDVKKAVKELKLRCGSGTCRIIDEIFGEKLI